MKPLKILLLILAIKNILIILICLKLIVLLEVAYQWFCFVGFALGEEQHYFQAPIIIIITLSNCSIILLTKH